MYNYIVCGRHYQESNSPLIPLKRGSQNNLSVYSSLENAYNQLVGYANAVRIEEIPFAVKSLRDLKEELKNHKDETNFILLVAHESQLSIVPADNTIKIYDKVDYYIQVVLPDQILYKWGISITKIACLIGLAIFLHLC